MDHGCDFVYFGLWLVAVGIVAGAGAARWLLPGAWLLDKAIVGVFKLVRGRELNDWAPIDAAFRSESFLTFWNPMVLHPWRRSVPLPWL
jgi:hypothetical protein